MSFLRANKTRVAMVILVAIQLIVMILFSMQKIGYHMDEMLGYHMDEMLSCGLVIVILIYL